MKVFYVCYIFSLFFSSVKTFSHEISSLKKKHCKYSKRNCAYLNRPFNEGFAQLVWGNRQVIKDAAKLYGVDPRGIVLVIMAESSMNYDLGDYLQEWLVKLKVLKDGSIFGKEFTFGWGQIRPNTALEVESFAAKVEQRKIRGREELIQDLLIPNKSIYHISAILKYITVRFKKEANLDLQMHPAFLMTLYNVGRTSKYIEEFNSDHEVWLNYFGIFYYMHLKMVEKLLDDKFNAYKVLKNPPKSFKTIHKEIVEKRRKRKLRMQKTRSKQAQ